MGHPLNQAKTHPFGGEHGNPKLAGASWNPQGIHLQGFCTKGTALSKPIGQIDWLPTIRVTGTGCVEGHASFRDRQLHGIQYLQRSPCRKRVPSNKKQHMLVFVRKGEQYFEGSFFVEGQPLSSKLSGFVHLFPFVSAFVPWLSTFVLAVQDALRQD